MLILTDWHNTPDYDRTLGPKCRCSERYIGSGGSPHKVPNRSACELPQPASIYGQFGCDGTPALGRASLEAARAAMIRPPDAVFVLGDFVTHDSPSFEWDQSVFWNMSAEVSAAFPNNPRACLIPLGNNDVWPNYFTNTSATNQYASMAQAAKTYCGLDDENVDLFTRKGYYSVVLRVTDDLSLIHI